MADAKEVKKINLITFLRSKSETNFKFDAEEKSRKIKKLVLKKTEMFELTKQLEKKFG